MRHAALAVGLALLALAAPLAAQPAPALRTTAGEPDLSARLQSQPLGGRVILEEVPALGRLFLERFEVVAADAELIVHGIDGPRRQVGPQVSHFKGEIEDRPGSIVLLAAGRGGLRGIATDRGSHWVLGRGDLAGAPEAQLVTTAVDPTVFARQSASFTCALEDLDPGDRSETAGDSHLVLRGAADALATRAAVTSHTARIAVDSDFEFFSKFPNADAAFAYVFDLFAYASVLYSRDIDTSLVLSRVDLWSLPQDPWNQSSPTCGLFEFGKYWNDNRGGVSRTIAHFLSGKSNGGGVAWVGVLCNGSFNANASACGLGANINAGGGYGYTGHISGTFQINDPSVIWDIVAMAHEIGHNFDSPHTHCYNGLGGNAAPIDQCFSGDTRNGGACYEGATSTPGPAGSGSGTIMSYCHLRGGGFSNISLTFGANAAETFVHPFGVLPQRVPQRMRSHVLSRAAAVPACLSSTQSGTIFFDGFETGHANRWN